MADANATAKPINFGETGIMRKAWVSGRLVFSYFDGGTLTFDKRLATQTNRANAEEHGWEARIGDAGAVLVAEFPDRKARAAEARRRMGVLVAHYQSPSEDWDIKVSRQSGPTRADVVEALNRVFPGKDAERAIAVMMTKRNLDEKGALAVWAETKEAAKALIDIKAERAIAAAANRPDTAQALMDEMMGEGE